MRGCDVWDNHKSCMYNLSHCQIAHIRSAIIVRPGIDLATFTMSIIQVSNISLKISAEPLFNDEQTKVHTCLLGFQ